MAPEIQEDAHRENYFVRCDNHGVIYDNLSLNEANEKAHQHNVQNFECYAEVVIEHD